MTLTPFSKIGPALVASFAVAYVSFSLVKNHKIFGGTRPEDMPTLQGAWEEGSRKMLLSKEREGNPDVPVLLNPFRHNMPATVRNAGDLPSLD
ncbi:hypothetical protein WJX72_002082 [[Myrmecia] bisecta]|uniref:Uncharacterized protein n=1 Tax=[Myrmecia] bisecta TaxID=41462 RepID=A0AAW1QED2_9CHLO